MKFLTFSSMKITRSPMHAFYPTPTHARWSCELVTCNPRALNVHPTSPPKLVLLKFLACPLTHPLLYTTLQKALVDGGRITLPCYRRIGRTNLVITLVLMPYVRIWSLRGGRVKFLLKSMFRPFILYFLG